MGRRAKRERRMDWRVPRPALLPTSGVAAMKRLFRGLRCAPDGHYDAVIIGSGIGGLITANLLARDGARVLLLEQHYMAGGYCSTFRRGGYTFDAATHFYPLLGNPETLTGRLLAALGVETGWVKMDPVDTFHLPDGSRFAVPADFAAYLAKLHAEFPHESAALDAFFAEVRETYLLGLLEYFRGRETERLAPYRDLTVRQALDRRFADRKLKLLLTADCPHWGSPPGRTSFVFDSMLRLSYFLGNYYPQGGSQAFAAQLAPCFPERGARRSGRCPRRRPRGPAWTGALPGHGRVRRGGLQRRPAGDPRAPGRRRAPAARHPVAAAPPAADLPVLAHPHRPGRRPGRDARPGPRELLGLLGNGPRRARRPTLQPL